MDRRWICNDIWMDMFPFFDRPQLGLKLALLSPRFELLVDKHFDGQSELTIWRHIEIRKDINSENAKLFVRIKTNLEEEGNFVEFPLPERQLPSKICFGSLQIDYIDHSVIAFLRSNKHVFNRGSSVCLRLSNQTSIWNFFAHEIWPVFAPNICHLFFPNSSHLQNLRCFISPTILSDLNTNSMCSGNLLPAVIGAGDEPNATSGQALAKWLHMPRSDGKPKRLCCAYINASKTKKWINKFKEEFLRSTTSANYTITLLFRSLAPPIEPFELVNERTNEVLTLDEKAADEDGWMLKRRKIGETAAVQRKDEKKLNVVYFYLKDNSCIGPLSPPTTGQSDGKDI